MTACPLYIVEERGCLTMKLVRIRKVGLAKAVAKGVRRYNGVALSPGRIIANPHFAIMVRAHLAGWIGYELRRPRVYEIAHLSVRPKYRGRGLAECATGRMLARMRNAGGRMVYARVRRSNYAPQRLLRKFAFKRKNSGRLFRFVRYL